MSSLTKDQLRNELISHGVEPPQSSSKKEEYLKLYNKHVLPVQNAAGEFSSDEEVIEESNGVGNGAESHADLSSVATLSDEQIRTGLRSYGLDVGPVVATTRQFMEKKLFSLMNGSSGGSLSHQPLVLEADSNDDIIANGDHTDGIEESAVSSVPALQAVNGNGNGHADESYSCDSSDGESELPAAVPATRAALASAAGADDTAAAAAAAESSCEERTEVRRRVSPAKAKVSASAVTGSDAVRAVYLRGGRDTPSPRRPISEARGGGFSYSTFTTTVGSSCSSASLSTHRNRAVMHSRTPAAVKRQSSRFLSTLSFCFLVLIILVSGLFVGYRFYDQDGRLATALNSVEEAATEALKKFRRLNAAEPPQAGNL